MAKKQDIRIFSVPCVKAGDRTTKPTNKVKLGEGAPVLYPSK